MKTKKRTTLLCAALMLLLAGVAGFAQRHFLMAVASRAAKADVRIQLAGTVQRGPAVLPLEKATMVKPGEILQWTISSENEGNAAALDYKAVGHIPRGTSFVSGSAKAEGARIVYSIDGGKSFSPQPMIEEKQPDGSVKRVPAPAAMYTEIRYEWADPLAEGGKRIATYNVRVK